MKKAGEASVNTETSPAFFLFVAQSTRYKDDERFNVSLGNSLNNAR